MKANWVIAAVLCTAASATAQDRTLNANDKTGQLVTMTGCVTREDLSYASGRKSVDGRAVTSGGSADKFLLSDARVSRPGQEKTVGTSGTVTSNSDPVAVGGARYLLVGQSADMRQHLGHQVEVVGRVAAFNDVKGSGPMVTESNKERNGVAATGTSSASAADRETKSGVDSEAFSGPSIQVDSIKMISAACTPSK